MTDDVYLMTFIGFFGFWRAYRILLDNKKSKYSQKCTARQFCVAANIIK